MSTQATLRDLKAFRIGHAHNKKAATGTTVFLAPGGATGAVAVRGGGPATRETDLLRPEATVQKIHGVVLSGGSAFGLEAASGVMDALAAIGVGFELAGVSVPIVCGACLFDLPIGKIAYPTKAMGRAAAEKALGERGLEEPRQGNVGAGCGATIGKFAAPTAAMKAGFGWSCQAFGDLVVGAGVALNALGSVRDRTGRWIAGARDERGQVMDPAKALEMMAQPAAGVTNTTLGVVLTNAKLTKDEACAVASMAHDGYARAILPVHTSMDGDTCFVMASGELACNADAVGLLAAEVVQDAIIAAAMSAQGAYGLPGAADSVR